MYYIVDGDDLADDNYQNFVTFVHDMVNYFDCFKMTAFAIPGMLSDKNSLYFINQFEGNIQLALHGNVHTNRECKYWSKKIAISSISKHLDRGFFVKGFKPPHWISSVGLEEALVELDLWMAIRRRDSIKNQSIIKDLEVYELSNNSIHGHISNYNEGLFSLRRRLLSLARNTEFRLVSEVIKEDKK